MVAIIQPRRTLLCDVERNTMRELAAQKMSRFFAFADFSPADEWLVCPHEEPTAVQLVSVLNGNKHCLQQDGFVNQATFSNDGRWLAVGHGSGATLWQRTQVDPAAWNKQGVDVPEADVTALAFTPDSKQLYFGTGDGRVLRLDLEDGDGTVREQYSHDAFKVWAIACSDNLVASAGRDVRVFDRTRRQVVQTIAGNQDEVRGVCFSPDGGTLVLGGRDGSITVWTTAGFALVGKLSGHSGIVQNLDATDLADGSWSLASVSQDYTMRLWGMPAAIERRNIETIEPVIAAVLADDAASLTYATTPAGPTVETDLLGPFPVFGATVETYAGRMRDLSRYCIRVRDLTTRVDRLSVTREEDFTWIALSAASTFALGTHEGRVKVGNVATGYTAEIQLTRPVNIRNEEELAALSRDGRWLALNHGDGSITVWNVESGRTECTIQTPTLKQLYAMVFGDEGTTLVFVCGDQVCLHDTATGKLLVSRFRHGHRDKVRCLAYSHAARRLAIGSFDDTASLWDIGELPTEGVVLRGHRASIQGIHLLDNARHVLTVGGDHCTKLWDAQTGRMRLTLHNTNWTSTSASEGRTLATLGRRSIQFFCYATAEEVAASAWWREQLSTRGHSQLPRVSQPSTANNAP
jgi:WD40 repeat protein